jgi:hypothetical protein
MQFHVFGYTRSSRGGPADDISFGLPAFYYGEVIGRATLLLLGFPPMLLWMLLLAISFATGDQGDNTRIVLFGVFGTLFVASYAPSAGTSPFAISAEVFPLVIREVGHSIAVAINFILLGITLLVFPILRNAMGGYSAILGLFVGFSRLSVSVTLSHVQAALNFLAFILCFIFVPETKGRYVQPFYPRIIEQWRLTRACIELSKNSSSLSISQQGYTSAIVFSISPSGWQCAFSSQPRSNCDSCNRRM